MSERYTLHLRHLKTRHSAVSHSVYISEPKQNRLIVYIPTIITNEFGTGGGIRTLIAEAEGF